MTSPDCKFSLRIFSYLDFKSICELRDANCNYFHFSFIISNYFNLINCGNYFLWKQFKYNCRLKHLDIGGNYIGVIEF